MSDIPRLVILRDHILATPELFDLSQWFAFDHKALPLGVTSICPSDFCDTPACIAGDALKLFAPHQRVALVEIPFVAQNLLGLDRQQRQDLFTPSSNQEFDGNLIFTGLLGYRSRESITAREAARTLDILIHTGTVDWSHIDGYSLDT